MSENETHKLSSKYWIAYFAIFAFGMATIPVHDWFDYAVRCKGANPLAPLNPAIVSGFLNSFFHASITLLAIHFLIFNRSVSIGWKFICALICVFFVYVSVGQYSSAHRTIKWSNSADSSMQSHNQWWCEQRSRKD